MPTSVKTASANQSAALNVAVRLAMQANHMVTRGGDWVPPRPESEAPQRVKARAGFFFKSRPLSPCRNVRAEGTNTSKSAWNDIAKLKLCPDSRLRIHCRRPTTQIRRCKMSRRRLFNSLRNTTFRRPGKYRFRS